MFEKVRDIIVETLSCDADQVTMEANLAEDLDADTGIPDEELTKMKTVGDIVEYLEANA